MKSNPLTKTHKKRTIAKDGFLSFFLVWKRFQAIKKAITGSLVSLSSLKVFTIIHLPKGRKVKVVNMTKKFFASFGGKIWTVFAVLLVALFVTACGGGGGGGTVTPPPTTVTVTCPDDSKQTAATLDLATAACPGIDATKVTFAPANNATGVSPDTIATSGIVIATSSTLATPALADFSLKAGTTAVPVTVTMSAGNKGFKAIPSTKLLYAQVYSGIVNLTDTLGKKLSLPFSFTTASVQCVAPQVPNSAGDACVTPSPCTAPAVWTASLNTCLKPIGSQAIGMNQLPASALLIGDTGWNKAVTDGVQKFLDSGMLLTGYNTRPIVFAFYKAPSGTSCVTPIYKDDGSAVDNNKAVGNACNTVDADWAVGTLSGVVRHFPSLGMCYEISWNQATQRFQDLQVTCPF